MSLRRATNDITGNQLQTESTGKLGERPCQNEAKSGTVRNKTELGRRLCKRRCPVKAGPASRLTAGRRRDDVLK